MGGKIRSGGARPSRTQKTPSQGIVLIENMPSGSDERLGETSRRRSLALIAAQLLAASCARRKRPPAPLAPRPGSVETGIASWYGEPYHGRRAANGEIYDMEKLTAAHRTLPFDTWVEVENLANGKRVRVRITDRGPFVDGRIIDLSRAAAREIDMIRPGIVKVRLEVIQPPGERESPAQGLYAVQVGAYLNQANAERMRRSLGDRYGECRLVRRDGPTAMWRVVIGRESSPEAAQALAARLGAEFGAVFVVRLDSAGGNSL
jgi:rare lipoprotein A